MLGKVVTMVSAAVLAKFILNYMDWLDVGDTFMFRVQPGDCRTVIHDGGAEDVTDLGEGLVIMSTIMDAPGRDDFMTLPHGIYAWKDQESGSWLIYVLTHPADKDMIEVFEFIRTKRARGTMYSLKYLRTITDPNFKNMNDLVVVGRDQFYITKFWTYRPVQYYQLVVEVMTMRHWGGVMFYDGRRARSVVEGLFQPNGINMSPDGKMVYVAEFGNKRLLGYHRSINNNLSPAWEEYADTLVDNIEVDADTGTLWIGCHPVNYRIIDDMFGLFGYALPSQVIRAEMTSDGRVAEIQEVFADDGSRLYGSTAATNASGKLVIGTVSRQAMICDMQ
ncbi:PON1-like protein [Mya arenaria]|uniref:PON1-like protein n=1 Tax=Mya arenaria TaxID=6604 RepID=A0ABY7FNP5_MYAAR|nr:PON1-like protein [Mya arenaria]